MQLASEDSDKHLDVGLAARHNVIIAENRQSSGAFALLRIQHVKFACANTNIIIDRSKAPAKFEVNCFLMHMHVSVGSWCQRKSALHAFEQRRYT